MPRARGAPFGLRSLITPRAATVAVVVLLVALLTAVGNGQPAYAATITVNTTDDELNSDGDCSLREAIQAANTDTAVDGCAAGSGADTIDVPAGTYTLSIPGTAEDANATGDLDITDDLSITGVDAATTIVDGGAIDRVFDIPLGVTVEMSGVTVQNGKGTGGGGIVNFGNVTLTNVTVSGNTADYGGGIYNYDTATLTNVTVSDNSANEGGGIYNYDTATLTNVTVSDNSAAVRGGGIYSRGDGALTNSTVSGNTADEGGGIYIHSLGNVTLTNSTVSGNTAYYGGGIYNVATVTLTGSTVSGNTAYYGGGIYNVATVTLTGSTVSGNTAYYFGGSGIYNSNGAATLTNSTVSGIRNYRGMVTLTAVTVSDSISNELGTVTLTDVTVAGISNRNGTATLTDVTVSGSTGSGVYNYARSYYPSYATATVTLTDVTVSGNSGSGIYNWADYSAAATVTLTNVTVSGNTANYPFRGGGIYNRGDGYNAAATVTLTNVTVSGNTADYGGGIYNEVGDYNADDTVALTNSIVVNNVNLISGGDCWGTITSGGHNLDSDGSCGLTGTGDLPSTNPMLGPLADNGGPTRTHALPSGSPAVDAGDAGPCPATDQRGVARPQGTACDMGAYELDDTDGDGILDVDDACPLLFGVPEENGCPPPGPPLAVGGIAGLLDADSGNDAVAETGGSEPIGYVAALAGVVGAALIAGGWYARRRWMR